MLSKVVVYSMSYYLDIGVYWDKCFYLKDFIMFFNWRRSSIEIG